MSASTKIPFSWSRVLKTATIILLFFVVVGGFGWWWSFSVPVPQTKLSKLKNGMNEAEVIRLLGPPGRTNLFDNGVSAWIYERRLSSAFAFVWFDSNGKSFLSGKSVH